VELKFRQWCITVDKSEIKDSRKLPLQLFLSAKRYLQSFWHIFNKGEIKNENTCHSRKFTWQG